MGDERQVMDDGSGGENAVTGVAVEIFWQLCRSCCDLWSDIDCSRAGRPQCGMEPIEHGTIQ